MKHIGIIMDGNRRWAKQRFLSNIIGHKAGADNAIKIIEFAEKRGIEFLTLWALSKENIQNRKQEEIEGIIKIINNFEVLFGKILLKNFVFDIIGDISKLPKENQKILTKMKEKTKNNSGMTVILALAYSGQDEIVRATQKIIKSGIDPDTLTEEVFRSYTDTGKFPIIDMIIRTGGDTRHSGFMLFDSAYSEYYFDDVFWPDFGEKELDQAIKKFHLSKRNFGK